MINRKKGKSKIGLALGMGGARGLCHIGVIKVLQKAGIEIDFIAGVSMGALVGAGYAMDLGIERIQTIALETDWKRLFSLMDMCFPTHGLIDGSRIEDFIKMHIGNAQFNETRIPFSVVATDVVNGERVVFRDGSIAKAVRASLSIPIFLKPYDYGGKVFLDGGLCDPVPVKLVREMGADYVIAVNSFFDLKKYFSKNVNSGEKKKYPEEKRALGMREVASRMIAIMEEHLALPQLEDADIVITPDMQDVGMLDFIEARDIIRRGEEAAEEVLERI